jgi:hypothetical protein
MARPESPPGRVPILCAHLNNLLDAFRQRVLLKRAKVLRIRASSAAQNWSSGSAPVELHWLAPGAVYGTLYSITSSARSIIDGGTARSMGVRQDRWGYGKAKRLGGPEVNDHLELGRELHRKIARLLAAQDAIHIGGGATTTVSKP